MAIADSVLDSIGNTPLIRLNHITKGLHAEILVKVESQNPAFSVKDRIGKSMIEAAEKDGRLKPGGHIIEATSGNTGIALAFVARAKGYRCSLVMAASVSNERKFMMRLLGAEVILTTASKGTKGAIAYAQKLTAETPGSFNPDQFGNPANTQIHRETTAEEIWRDTEGNIDIFVAGIGTGGTFSGVSEVIKSRKPLIAIAVEPARSPVIAQTRRGEELKPSGHGIQGLGTGFIPGNLNLDLVDDVVAVEDEDAYETARVVAELEGIPVGISCGAAIWAAIQVAKRPESKDKRIVTVAPDLAERYLSTPFAAALMEEISKLPIHEI